MKGNMQLFSVDQQRSQALEAHAASFATFKVSVSYPSLLFLFYLFLVLVIYQPLFYLTFLGCW